MAKIIEIHNKIVEIQILIDRQMYNNDFKQKVFKQRKSLDKFYWESKFYFTERTQELFDVFLEGLMSFEVDIPGEDTLETQIIFTDINRELLEEFKTEIIKK
ncbi:hypothetical protein [Aquimarina rubra]|uniref:Uncharacterized protein n=1 Tax=Aquimarina rubra TaxID=1920033 RepID=A0ABW5LHI4_9FLAO